jgi:EpsI family protein
MAAYAENVQGTELVSDHNRVLPDEWSGFSTTSKESFDKGMGQIVDVNEVQVRKEGSESLVWYWYGVGDRTATTSMGVKLLQVLEFVTAGRSDGEVYLLETPLTPALKSDRERLRAVARELAVDGSIRSTLTARRDRL